MSGCAVFGRRVPLSYALSRNIHRAEHKTIVAVTPFLDKRENPKSVGRAPALFGMIGIPARATSDVAPWITDAALRELDAIGYRVDPKADWKVGGAVQSVDCGGRKRTVCTVKVEMWLLMKDGWNVLQRTYTGEGARPRLLPEEDAYALSLEEAVRDILTQFRRDVELMAP